jgi:flagellar biosynthesis chaperone FliJ
MEYMPMAGAPVDEARLVQVLQEHRAEFRAELRELSSVLRELGNATSQLATVTARQQEQHAQHEASARVLLKDLDDHEARIRVLEAMVTSAAAKVGAGWKTLTVVWGGAAVVISTMVTLAQMFFVN